MYRHKSGIMEWVRLAAFAVLLFSAAAQATPDLKLQDLNGRTRAISDYVGKGRWAIVAVWSADCIICRREIHHMTFLQEENAAVRVLGLSVDGPANRDKALVFAQEHSLNFPNLLGSPGDATRLSGQSFVGTPTYYFFAPDGRFAAQRVGALSQLQAEKLLDALKKTR